jgi:hypothetical protein
MQIRLADDIGDVGMAERIDMDTDEVLNTSSNELSDREKEIIEEARRVGDKIHANTTGAHDIHTRLSVIYAAGIAIAAQSGRATAFAIVPLLATGQLLYALEKERETQALGAWAHVLELRANGVLQERLFVWEHLVAQRPSVDGGQTFSQLFHVFLILGSWLIGAVFLFEGRFPGEWHDARYIIRVIYVIVAIVSVLALSQGHSTRLDLRDRLLEDLRGDSQLGPIAAAIATAPNAEGPIERLSRTLWKAWLFIGRVQANLTGRAAGRGE